jgi:hypothetical protein
LNYNKGFQSLFIDAKYHKKIKIKSHCKENIFCIDENTRYEENHVSWQYLLQTIIGKYMEKKLNTQEDFHKNLIQLQH